MISQPVAIFLLVLIIILLGPLVFTRLKIPPIVGMIIAGMAVGPYGFGLLERDASFKIFGEVGILYIMFQAAVEIDMFHLKQQYQRGILFGLLSFILPLALGVVVSHYAFNVGWDTSLLLASMYSSHTLVSYPVVSRFGLQNSRGAVIAVCGTIVAVMLALLVLAGVVQTREAGAFEPLGILKLLFFTGIYCVAVGYSFPYITRRFFRKNSEPVPQFIFILALVFVASRLAGVIGLESILGAFYAGLILNRMIPGRSNLMKNIRFVGDSIFIPYFLIGVGMLINAGVVFKSWQVIWVATLMTGVALSTKWLAAKIATLSFKLDKEDGHLMFGLTSGKAAATIAAVMVGYSHGMLTENLMNGAVVMILLCCIVASIVTERAGKNIRMQLTARELEHEDVGTTEFARQVVSVSNPLTSEGIMRMAIMMRNRLNRNPITALYVRNGNDQRARAMGRTALDDAVKVAEEMDVAIKSKERYDINVASALRNFAEDKEATEIVIGLHRKANIVDTFYGSLVEQLIELTNRMVIMSRCFIPVGTITKIVVVVPRNAEYETGFHLWVSRLCMLAFNIEARIVFISYRPTQDFIKAVIAEDKIEVDTSFEVLDSYDDFILLSSDITDDDLLVVIAARKGSISYSSDLDALPGFLSRYFNRHNLMVIYPKQF
ncbi:MAG: cation:proton antiporter [Bacteroidales bacterium]|nr:cation:proton antiporter [Bacteroidales bacterium]MBD5205083.1 cation:proton antiporter [Bacteroidales bacterium]MBD5223185.1 cation:proton antiporter [Bacteroidales bacterium]MBD5301634.1 cation:proton antiporter [Bacteroides sp.]